MGSTTLHSQTNYSRKRKLTNQKTRTIHRLALMIKNCNKLPEVITHWILDPRLNLSANGGFLRISAVQSLKQRELTSLLRSNLINVRLIFKLDVHDHEVNAEDTLLRQAACNLHFLVITFLPKFCGTKLEESYRTTLAKRLVDQLIVSGQLWKQKCLIISETFEASTLSALTFSAL